jgi:hypothetical protein
MSVISKQFCLLSFFLLILSVTVGVNFMFSISSCTRSSRLIPFSALGRLLTGVKKRASAMHFSSDVTGCLTKLFLWRSALLERL